MYQDSVAPPKLVLKIDPRRSHSSSFCVSERVSVSVKILATIANEKALPVYHLDVKEEIFTRLPSGCGEFSGKICDFSNPSTD